VSTAETAQTATAKGKGMIRVLRMSDVDLKGKRVLIREDLNVPVKDGVVTSDARIRASLRRSQRRRRPAPACC